MLTEATVFLASSMVLASHFSSYITGTARYWVRIVLYFATLFLVSLAAFPICLVMTILGRRYDTNFMQAKVFYASMSFLLGWECEVEGAEYLNTNPAIYVANHQSAVDILWIGRIMPLRCVVMAKKSIQWAPILGQWMTLAGTVFIDRGNSKKAMASLDKATEDIKEKSLSLFMFPEGTRTSFETPNLLPFKKGAFNLAVKAGVPVVPIVCENYWRLYRKGVFESGKLKIKVLPPIPTTGMTTADVGDLANKTREIMLATLKEISVAVSDDVAAADNATLDKISAKRTPPSALPKEALVSPPSPEETVTNKGSATPHDYLASPGTPATGSATLRAGAVSPTGSSATDEDWATVEPPSTS
ncbi:1-acylglycerol-3-phosphate O-acyltransferase [Tulasnella sp. JGI-2019a]|nr:1-acylglycerol-3-phosphate O-acyltransferase [Tulasnella sp. JGI-2019a]KAG9015851.1 1-acylglycerol-3-phosphate O-acyltransferase [Tulasnella sp. JGI-2019a]KAG9039516.1 1-acylglycerol-3-phosphate O-acyltransferase [Tulasnella sp. JGI-2019a]